MISPGESSILMSSFVFVLCSRSLQTLPEINNRPDANASEEQKRSGGTILSCILYSQESKCNILPK
jgi:hypothetical protein